jgi:hypothetical protein
VPWEAAGLADSPLRRAPVAGAAAPAEPTIEAAVRQLSRQAAPLVAPTALPLRGEDTPGATVRIDLLALQQAGYLVPTQSRSRLAEEFRRSSGRCCATPTPKVRRRRAVAGDGHQRAALRRQDLLLDQPRDEPRDGGRQLGAARRCRRRATETCCPASASRPATACWTC